jgi:hypothetical protein
MSKGNKGGVIKTIITTFYINGELRNEPDSTSRLSRFSKETMEQLRRFARLVMQSGFVSGSSKMYYSNKHTTINAVYLKERKNGNAKFDKIKNRIAYDTAKVSRHFGDMLHDVVMCKEPNLGLLASKLWELCNKYMNEFSLQDKIVMNMPSVKPCPALMNEEYMRIIEVLRTYSKKAVNDAEKSIGCMGWGYVEHLLQNQSMLEGTDKINFMILKESVQCGDVRTQNIKDGDVAQR